VHYFWGLTFLMAWVFAGWLFSGCATQMPVSEGLVFTEKESPAKNASFGEQISGEMAAGYSYIIPFEQLADAAANDFEDDSFDALDKTFLSTLLVPSFFIAYRDRVALGSTVSLPGFWQVDGTVRFFGQYYFTLNRKILLKNTEVILQRRLLYKNNGGISLGAFYRYDPLILKEENGDNTSSTFHISWFGLRTVL